jgi:hypothetical protein
MADTGSGIIDGIMTVTTAGTRQPMPSIGSTPGASGQTFPAGSGMKTVTIQALSTNEGKIAVGGITVVAAAGTHAAPTARGTLLNPLDTVSIDVCDTSCINLDATASGDGVSYMVLLA